MKARPYIAFLAEGSPTIGTGHVVETLNLARVSLDKGVMPAVWLNTDTPSGLIDGFPVRIEMVRNFGVEALEPLANEIAARGIRRVVTNLRCVTNEQVGVLRRKGFNILCIDEWGNRDLDCDAVVNTSPVADYHRYSSTNPGFKMYTGVGYLPLSPEFQTFHEMKRRHTGPTRSVVVSMGGVDRTGATIRLVQEIQRIRPDVTIHVVLGAGFTHVLDPGGNNVMVYRNLPGLAALLSRCDIGFTVGGNTLIEMACVGTPAVVLFEEPHEKQQTKVLESQGFGLCLGACTSFTSADIRYALEYFDDPAVRIRHSQAGKMLADGKGALRILDVIEVK